MGAERMEDGALRRFMRKWLKAGVLDTDGMGLHPATGPPQGGTGSPVLAKVFLHDVRDRWFEKGVKQHGRGEAGLIRYADDGAPRARRRPKGSRSGYPLSPGQPALSMTCHEGLTTLPGHGQLVDL